MGEKEFIEKVEHLLNIEASPMLISQLRELRRTYSYQEIINAIWFFYIHGSVKIDTVSKYGVGILRNAKNMEQANNYFKRLRIIRERARISAIEANKVQVNTIKTKRQKQKVRKEEYDWDEK